MKLCFLTKFIKNLIANTETINDTTIPISKIINCPIENILPSRKNLNIFSPLAPNITGIARKNENSAATYLEQPKIIAPRIVEPEREVPGISAKIWKAPIMKAVLYDSLSKLVVCDFLRRL